MNGEMVVAGTFTNFVLDMAMGRTHTFRDAKAFNTSLQLNGHHKSKQKRDFLCIVYQTTEKFHLH